MSDRYDRDATQIIAMARKSVGCDVEGDLLLLVAAMLRRAELRGEQRGYEKCRTEVLDEFEKFTPAKGEAA